MYYLPEMSTSHPLSNLAEFQQRINPLEVDRQVSWCNILDKRLTWWPHLSSKLQQSYQRLAMVFPILNRKSTLEKKCSLPILIITSK